MFVILDDQGCYIHTQSAGPLEMEPIFTATDPDPNKLLTFLVSLSSLPTPDPSIRSPRPSTLNPPPPTLHVVEPAGELNSILRQIFVTKLKLTYAQSGGQCTNVSWHNAHGMYTGGGWGEVESPL